MDLWGFMKIYEDLCVNSDKYLGCQRQISDTRFWAPQASVEIGPGATSYVLAAWLGQNGVWSNTNGRISSNLWPVYGYQWRRLFSPREIGSWPMKLCEHGWTWWISTYLGDTMCFTMIVLTLFWFCLDHGDMFRSLFLRTWQELVTTI